MKKLIIGLAIITAFSTGFVSGVWGVCFTVKHNQGEAGLAQLNNLVGGE